MKKRKAKMKRKGIFRESLNYIKESQRFIWIIVLIFLASSIIGFAFAGDFSEVIDPLLNDLIEKTEGLGTGGLIWFIFTNNVSSSFFGLIFGVFFGIFSVFTTLINGLVLGYVYLKTSAVGGYSIIWQLLPHGIFELPAAFISLGLGLKLGMFIFEKDKKKTFKERFLKSMKVFLTIVIPLLALAAIIEGLLIASVG